MAAITRNWLASLVLALGLGTSLLLASPAKPDALSDGRFHREVAAILRGTHPSATVVADPDPLQIRVDNLTIFLGNLYTQVEPLGPADRRKAIEAHFTKVLAGSSAQSGEPPCCANSGFAKAKPRLRIQISAKAAIEHAEIVASRPFSDQLVVTYVLDEDDRYQYVTRAMLDAWGVGLAALERQAVANLESASRETAFSLMMADDKPVLAMVKTGDGYDAARLLLPGYLAEIRKALKTDALILAAPTRDLLMVWPSESAARTRLAERARIWMREGPYGRSDELFRADATGLRPLDKRELAAHGR